MATLYCRLGTGVSSYVVHASYSTASDPYPNGATITTSWTLSYVKNNSTITIRASETTCESGYTFPVYVYTSTDGSTWTQVDYLQSGTVTFNAGTGVKYVRVGPATKGSTTYDTNPLYFRNGTGVSSFKIRYDSSSATGLVSGAITGTVGLFVRSGTRASLTSIEYESGYGSSFQFVEYTDRSYTTVKKYFEENDGYIDSNGTRYLLLTAAEFPYYYKVHAFGNGGTFTNQGGADNYHTALASSATVSINFNVGTLETPYRAGYTFLGWGYTSNATTYYKNQTIPISATSKSASDPTIYNLYAIWEKRTDTMHIKMGAGITSMSVYVDDELKARIQDTVYHDIAVHTDSTITIKSIAKASGYAKPYVLRFYQNSTSTTPISTYTQDTDTPSYDYSTARFYAEVTATKSQIDLFYWSSASADAALITKGKPVKNLTAVRWNRLKDKIQELAVAEGESYSYSEVSTGSTIKATEFNSVRSAIMNRSGYGTLPEAQTKGNPILAALFNGTNSLKSALNAAITHYNNS